MTSQNGTIKFAKISQYRNTVRSAGMAGNPTLDFVGTVKLHGSNHSVVIFPDGRMQLQSRNLVLSDESDPMGFVKFMKGVGLDRVKELILTETGHQDTPIVVYGEWCGGNIQKGVAITGLPKMWVVFAVRWGAEGCGVWPSVHTFLDMHSNEDNIFHVAQFGTYAVQIDFSRNASSIQQELVDTTTDVENMCPAGLFFDVEGIGEGVVWRCVTDGYRDEPEHFWFKVKGKKHSTSNVKVLKPANPVVPEFLDAVCTEARLLQGLDHLREHSLELSRRSTGSYLSWLYNDIAEEEGDLIESHGLDRKALGRAVARRGRAWYFRYLDDLSC